MGLAELVTDTRAAVALEERALQITPWGDWSSANGGPSAAGPPVTADSATQLMTVYGCVSLISDTIATLPTDVYRSNGDGTKTKEQSTPQWLDTPNDYSTMLDFKGQSCVSLLLDGNAYWTYEVNRNLAPTALHCVAPNRWTVRSNKGQEVDDGSGIAYYLDGKPYRGRLLHLKGITRPGALKGMSPVEAARQSIGVGLAAQEFAARFYSNGANLSGVIEVPGDLTQDQARDLKRGWARDHSGLSNAHNVGVIDNGAKWNSISVTPEQAQFLASREFQAAEIAGQMFLVDPAWFSISAGRGQNLTYANQEQRGVHFAQFTLMRWVVRLEQAFSKLLPPALTLKFNMDELKRADMKTRFEAWQIALGGATGTGQPWMTSTEVRDIEDVGPWPIGEQTPQPQPANVVQLPTPAPNPQPQAQAAGGNHANQ